LLLLELGDDIAQIHDGHELSIDVAAGTVTNLTTDQRISFNPVPQFMMDMLAGGGLVEYVKRKIAS
ncbi:MAG: 3-isopropylmalate dehydratase small subunit, partial [Desulfovibrionales bacterium]|nr:3-isopropylmalate dehydratase small subunit [Desulfovibrionales bacterium]